MTRPDDASIPDVDEPRTFAEPWQARAFAIAVALSERASDEGFPWEDFQSRLATERERSDEPLDETETAYYDDWVVALESLLLDRDLITPDELRERMHEFHVGDRDASEFVDGDPHAHTQRPDE